MDINSNYGDVMSKVSPGTFAPDISPQGPKAEPLPDDQTGVAGAASFKDTLSNALNSVNEQMMDAQQKSEDFAMGKTHDLEGTVKAVEEASLAMQMTMSVRNKIMSAYTEIAQMQL